MVTTIFLIFISLIGIPLYALCVVFLWVLQPITGWSYVDASVYVCEYFQPIFTAVIALLFLSFGIRYIMIAFRNKKFLSGIALIAICVPYIIIGTTCIRNFLERLSTYAGMSNREIFDFVVHKLNVVGAHYPKGSIKLFSGEIITYGYIMANMEVYIVPISIVLLLGLIQWRISHKNAAYKRP
jgi:hypothetical protein